MIDKLFSWLKPKSHDAIDFNALRDELKLIRGLAIEQRKETVSHIAKLVAEVVRIDDKVSKLDANQADMDGRLREVEAKITTGDYKRRKERTQDVILKFISGEIAALPKGFRQ